MKNQSWKRNIKYPVKGEWCNEPDKIQWTDENTGLPCLIVRNDFGALCGYVGVNSKHPYYMRYYSEIYSVHVHGGLTFSSKCAADESEHSICHIVEDGDDDNVWWLGFDCAHSGDYAPLSIFKRNTPDKYKNIEYVKNECKKLASQLVIIK